MVFRFYWDIFWLLNVIMNLFLMGMTAVLRHKNLKKRLLVRSCLLGSTQMTGIVVLWLRYLSGNGWKGLQGGSPQGKQMLVLVIPAVIIAVEMLQITFRERQIGELLKDLFQFFQVSLLTGGALLVCREWLGNGCLSGIWMIFAGTFGVWFVLLIMERYLRQEDKRSGIQDGEVVLEDGKRYPLRVMIDTGNCLVSPYSGERVMIMAQKLAKELDVEKNQAPLLIPFHSIGGDGILPAYRIPFLVLQDGFCARDFLAAVSPQLSEDSAVQLIMYGRK